MRLLLIILSLPLAFCITCKHVTNQDIVQAIYIALDGEHWYNSTGWPDGDLCNAHGIECVSPKIELVVGLNLTGNNLSGVLPEELNCWGNLQTLDVSYNNISISTDYLLLPPLHVFNGRSNNIHSVQGIRYIGTLRKMILGENPLVLNFNLGSLVALEVLEVDHTQLTLAPSLYEGLILDSLRIDHSCVRVDPTNAISVNKTCSYVDDDPARHTECPVGSCTPCLIGYYEEHFDQCVECPVGHYCKLSAKHECPIGTYQPSLAQHSCLLCANVTNLASAATECVSCGAGFVPSVDHTECVECPADTYRPLESTSCVECPPGHYIPPGSKTECLPSPRGFYTPGGDTQPYPCPPGTSQPNVGRATCNRCSTDQYQEHYGMTSCLECAALKENLYCFSTSMLAYCPFDSFLDALRTECKKCSADYKCDGTTKHEFTIAPFTSFDPTTASGFLSDFFIFVSVAFSFYLGLTTVCRKAELEPEAELSPGMEIVD